MWITIIINIMKIIYIMIQNEGEKDYKFKKGEMIAQGLFMKYLTTKSDKSTNIQRKSGSNDFCLRPQNQLKNHATNLKNSNTKKIIYQIQKTIIKRE